MPVLRSLLARNIEDPGVPLTSTALIDALGVKSTASGVNVTETDGMRVAAVWRAVGILSSQGASLPLRTYRDSDSERVNVQLLRQPCPVMTSYEFWEWIYVCLALWGNAYCWKVRDGLGRIRELWPIHPSKVRPGVTMPDRTLPSGKVFEVTDTGGVKHDRTDIEIFHIVGPNGDGVMGCSPIQVARQSIGMAIAAEEYGARLFGSGSLMSGVLTTDQRLKQADADALKARWQAKIGGLSNSHQVAILDAGAKFQPIGIPPGDAQFIESRKFQVAEVARWYGIPPHLLMDTEKSTSWGTGIEEQTSGFVTYTLKAQWLARVEQRVSLELCPAGISAKYALEGLLRGNTKDRYESYAVGRQWGFLTQNDINDLEDRPRVPGGDTYLVPVNMNVVDADGNVVGQTAAEGGDGVPQAG